MSPRVPATLRMWFLPTIPGAVSLLSLPFPSILTESKVLPLLFCPQCEEVGGMSGIGGGLGSQDSKSADLFHNSSGAPHLSYTLSPMRVPCVCYVLPTTSRR